MMHGWSLSQRESQWRQVSYSGGELSDQSLTVEIPTDEDTVTVTAESADGILYRGDYRYREGSCSNGELVLHRYRGPEGSVFIGEWKESERSRGTWILIANDSD